MATKKKPAKKTAKKTAPKKPAVKRAKPVKKGKKVVPTTAAAILGIDTPKTKSNTNSVPKRKPASIKREWKKYHDVLLDLRSRLLHQMGDLKKESAEEMSSYSMHMADAGTENFDRDSALSLLSSDQDAVYEIEEALKRIEEGSYGICELTGKTIPKSRLNAIPWARYTVKAQAQLEKDGGGRNRKIGNLGTIDGAGTRNVAVVESMDSETTTKKKKV